MVFILAETLVSSRECQPIKGQTRALVRGPLATSPEVSALRPFTESARWNPRYYAATVVALYGLVERFTTQLIDASVVMLADAAPAYTDLPESLRSINEKASTLAAVSAVQGRGRTGDSLEDIVMNLSSCFESNSDFRLNSTVIASSDANTRDGVVQQMLRYVGFEEKVDLGGSQKCTDALDGVLSGMYSTSASVINDLADRRNEVAHGSITSDLLGLETLQAVLDVVEGYLSGLFSVLAAHVGGWCIETRAIPIGGIHRTWKKEETGDRSIAGVIIADAVTLSVGDMLIGIGPDRVYVTSLDGIQVSRLERSSVVGDGSTSVGLDLGRPISKTDRLYQGVTDTEAAMAVINALT